MQKPSHQTGQVVLPALLEERLASDDGLRAAVYGLLRDVNPMLQWNKLKFFPDFTDHGARHVEAVLHTCVWLMPEESRKLLTPQDAAALVGACVLHDLAMHLNKIGVARMLAVDSAYKPVDWFRKRTHELPWHEQWLEFCGKARRFNDHDNTRIFGDPEPVRPPDTDLATVEQANWSEKQFLLVGEFVRRNHARMAHEFALYGFPAGTDIDVPGTLGDQKLANLIGLIARSHGMPLRDCVDYLADSPEYAKNKCDPRYVHAPYLMCLLRVADYLQVDPDRAPAGVAQLQNKIRSPISDREWKTHAAVEQIRSTGDDAEAITIDCLPQDCETFLNLRRLLAGLQAELDASWALLGEVYSKQGDLQLLGLTLRRVRSNLDRDDDVLSLVGDRFVPTHARFKSSDAKLLNLLVGPLYDDDPFVGLRELLQNAVDAHRELADLVKSGDIAPDAASLGKGISVTWELEGDEPTLTITDHGVGMTPDTVRNYFLNAGASFRMSDDWRRRHEDHDGHSRVLRSGRFGVGALAAFLLGDTIEVTTRHVTSQHGVRFVATITTDPIELVVDQTSPHGTTIHVKLSPHAVEAIHEKEGTPRWFFLAHPETRFNGDAWEGELPDERQTPLPEGWYRVQHDDFTDVHWQPRPRYSVASCYCNGIWLPGEHDVLETKPRYFGTPHVFGDMRPLPSPTVSIFDRDAKLPVSLDRMRLLKPTPFHIELSREMAKEWFAHLVTHASVRDNRSVELVYHPCEGSDIAPCCTIGGLLVLKAALPALYEWPQKHILSAPLLANTRVASEDAGTLYIEGDLGRDRSKTNDWVRDMVAGRMAYHKAASGAVALGSYWTTSDHLNSLPAYVMEQLVWGEEDGVEVASFGEVSDDHMEQLLRLAAAQGEDARVAVLNVPQQSEGVAPGFEELVEVWQAAFGDGLPLLDADARAAAIERARPVLAPYLTGEASLGDWWTIDPVTGKKINQE
ncbi:MAG: ATP-binding protein [Phycisphaerales bacterium JB060]